VSELAAEVEVALAAQVDLAVEAQRSAQFREHFHGRRTVLVPELHDGHWRDAVLLTDYVDGLVHADRADADGEEGARLARNLLHTLYDMIFGAGLVHLDLHPGNVLVDPAGRIVLLDFGLSAQLDPETREEFTDLFLGMATGDAAEVARIVYETAHAVDGRFDRARFLAETEAAVARHHGKEVAQFEVAEFVVDLMQISRRNGLRIATRFTRILLALVVFEGTLRAWDPHLDFQREARVFIGRLRSGDTPVEAFRSGRSAAVFRPIS
jgi:ubiquinone biosynthesis protein